MFRSHRGKIINFLFLGGTRHLNRLLAGLLVELAIARTL